MEETEVDAVTQGRRKELFERGVLTMTKHGKYAMNMSMLETGCPSLKDYKCTIHTRRKRPDTCRQFPIFLEGKTVKVSTRCLASKQGLFYPYLARLSRMGYRIIEGSNYSDSELYRLLPDPDEEVKKQEPEKENKAQAQA